MFGGSARLSSSSTRLEKDRHMRSKKRRRLHPAMIEELMSMSPKTGNKYFAFQMVLSFFREDFPWLYEAGMDVVQSLKTSNSMKQRDQLVNEYMDLVEFSFEHPIMREMAMPDKEQYMILRELPYILKQSLKYGE